MDSASRQTRSSSAWATTSTRSGLQQLLDQSTISPTRSNPLTADDIERLVEAHIPPRHQSRSSTAMVGLIGNVHLAAAGEDVGGAILVHLEHHAIGGWRMWRAGLPQL
jgi:hypothetical protein